MELETSGHKLKRISQTRLILRCALLGSFLVSLGSFVVWRVAADPSLTSHAIPAVTPYEECPGGCKADEHCNQNLSPRVCEPNTTFAATVLPSGEFDNKVEKVFSPRTLGLGKTLKEWYPPKGVDGVGCPISSYGAYPMGQDGKCHWCPPLTFLGSDNKCHCVSGYFQLAKVDNSGKVSKTGKYPKCTKLFIPAKK